MRDSISRAEESLRPRIIIDSEKRPALSYRMKYRDNHAPKYSSKTHSTLATCSHFAFRPPPSHHGAERFAGFAVSRKHEDLKVRTRQYRGHELLGRVRMKDEERHVESGFIDNSCVADEGPIELLAQYSTIYALLLLYSMYILCIAEDGCLSRYMQG